MKDERGDGAQTGVTSGWGWLSTSTGSVQRLGGFWVSAGVSMCAEGKAVHEFRTNNRMDGVQMEVHFGLEKDVRFLLEFKIHENLGSLGIGVM